MIKIIGAGQYRLIDTKKGTRVLHLDDQQYAWIDVEAVGEILVVSHNPHPADSLVSSGEYVLYEVEDEPELIDQQHLELEVGEKKWQGYLLPTGLPTSQKFRSRIIPTKEVISGNGFKFE